MKDYSYFPGMLLTSALIFGSISLNPLLKKKEEKVEEVPVVIQDTRKISHWECWLDGTYTKISITRGYSFTAVLHTNMHGEITLYGSEKVDHANEIVELFGSVGNSENVAIGTFSAKQATLIGQTQLPEKTLLGEIDMVTGNRSYTIIISPLP
ncbi:MAG: hypothetical protein V4686_00925 [Patescibacteria group bacterium]